jgi:hypothetical protein
MSNLSWGGFKTLESGLGLTGYSAPTFLDKMAGGVGSFGGIYDGVKNLAGGVGNMFSKASDHFSANKDLYNFAGTALGAYGQYDMQQKAADEAKRMNNFYMSQFDREKKRQEEAEMALAQGFNNSGFGPVRTM